MHFKGSVQSPSTRLGAFRARTFLVREDNNTYDVTDIRLSMIIDFLQLSMEAVRIDIKNQEVGYTTHVDEIPREYDPDLYWERKCEAFVPSLLSLSKPCDICLQKANRQEKQSLSVRLRKCVAGRGDLEEKLKRYNVKCERPRNPFKVFSRCVCLPVC